MDAPTPEDVRRALAGFDALQQKVVTGLLAAMMQRPEGVRDREWISEQLTHVTLLAGEFEANSPDDGIRVVQEFLQTHSRELLSATLLLFQRVGLDLAPRAAEGFTLEEALKVAVEYLPPADAKGDANGETLEARAPSSSAPAERNLGEQPLARLMTERGLSAHDLVAASTEQITHKMVTRAMKGRRLTANTMDKVHRAWNQATSGESSRSDLFTYEP